MKLFAAPPMVLGMLLAASAAQADFHVDPKLLESSAASSAPAAFIQVVGVSDESAKRGAEIAQALAEWNAAWEALDAANKRLSALLNHGPLSQPATDDIQRQVSRASAMQPPPMPVPAESMNIRMSPVQPSTVSDTEFERLYLVGEGPEHSTPVALKPGEYSRAHFLAAVLPKQFKSAFVGSGQPFNKVIVAGPPRPWERWLASSGAATRTVFTVLYKNRLVVYSGQ